MFNINLNLPTIIIVIVVIVIIFIAVAAILTTSSFFIGRKTAHSSQKEYSEIPSTSTTPEPKKIEEAEQPFKVIMNTIITNGENRSDISPNEVKTFNDLIIYIYNCTFGSKISCDINVEFVPKNGRPSKTAGMSLHTNGEFSYIIEKDLICYSIEFNKYNGSSNQYTADFKLAYKRSGKHEYGYTTLRITPDEISTPLFKGMPLSSNDLNVRVY